MSAIPYLVSANNAATGVATLATTVGQVNGVVSGSASGTNTNDVIHVSANTNAAVTITGVSDTQSNKYAVINADSTQVDTAQWVTVGNTVALSSTDIITVTFSGTGGTKCVIVIAMTGVLPVPDQVPATTNGTAATSSTITSGTLTEPNAVAIAVIGAGAAVSAPAWASGFTQITNERNASNQWLTVAYKVVSTNAAVTATSTFPSDKYCAMLATFIIPSPSFPYLVGEASAAAGGSSILAVPIRGTITSGDTMVVGALATAGSVTGVTDAGGNSYSLVQSETTTAGCQVYTYAAYNASPPAGAGSLSTARFGNSVNINLYPTTSTRALSAAAADAQTPTAPMALAAQKMYYQQNGDGTGKYPTNPGGFTFVDGSNRDITSLVTAGLRVWLCFQPNIGTYNSGTGLWTITPGALATEQANFEACVQYWLNNHPQGANGIRVIIYQEPQNAGGTGWPFNNGTSAQNAANYVSIFRNYANGIQALTDPAGRHAKVVYDAAGHANSKWLTYYPGNSYVDEITVDFYGNTYISYYNGGTDPDPLYDLHNLADANGKPFAVTEMGNYIGTGNITQGQFEQYIAYVQSIMTGSNRGTGYLNTDCMWYAGDASTPNQNTIGYNVTTGLYIANDARIPYLEAFWNAISVTPSTVNVQYSGTVSAQAAIVIGDNNVGSPADKTVGATNTTGATASVATGTLAQSEEHIIAFAADLAAGGQPVLGDGLYTVGGVEAGTSAFLTAGFKNVATTASDTPSATFSTTTWAISVVTNPVTVPVITSVPGQGFVGQPYSVTLTALGGVGTLTWGETGTLPTGLTLTGGGVLSGTPSVAGSYPVTLSVTDSLGLQGTLPVTITILTLTGPGGGPAQHFFGNLLTYADADMEGSLGYTWAAYSNASAPARTTAVSVTGSYSTAWSASAAGTSEISTGYYAVVPGQPYICSAFMLTGTSHLANIGFAWYDNTHTLIAGIDQGNATATQNGTWSPLAYASVAPGNAVWVKLVAVAQNCAQGDAINIDDAFLTQSIAQVLIDWNTPAFQVAGSAGQQFMDVSPWVRLDQGITYTRGRQDAVSEIQPGSASFQLQNDLGQFSRFSAVAIPAAIGGEVTIQRRCQINLADESGQWWTRFDGPLSELDFTVDTVGNTAIVAVTVTDVLAYLNRQDVLFSWTEEQALADDPLYHWPLSDGGAVGGAMLAAETSGNNGPPMRLVNSEPTVPTVAAVAWGDTSGGIETLADAVSSSAPDGSAFWTPGINQPSNVLRGLVSGVVGPFTTPVGSILLTPVQTPQSAQNTFIGGRGYMLEAELTVPMTPTALGNDYSLECWFTMDTSIASGLGANNGPYIALGLGSSRAFTNLLAGLFLNAGTLKIECATYNQPPAFKGLNWSGVSPPAATASTSATIAADKVKRPHHLVITILGDPAAATVTLWIDGVTVGTFTLPKGQTYDTLTVGGAYGGCGAWFGNLSQVSIYPDVLSSQQIVTHCQLGQYGMWENTTDDCIAQLASYANIPSFWTNIVAQSAGLSMAEYTDITGSNALSGIQQIEQAEQGLLFVDAAGAVNFHTRDWRMGYGPPDVLLPPDTFDADMQFKLTDQFQCNEMGVTGPNTEGATATTIIQNPSTGATSTETTTTTLVQASYINTASQQKYGVYAQSPVSSPTSVALLTWSRASAALGIPSFSYWPDPNLADMAAWNANSRADPWLLPASINVDLLTLDPTSGLAISSFYGLEIDNMIAPSGTLPASLPTIAASLEWFIEGVTETVSLTARSIQFYTSPVEAQRAWIPADPVYGVLGTTTRIGISAMDLSVTQADGKDVSHDAGPPYWPPAFSGTMNNPAQNGHAFVGAVDMRGLAQNLSLMLEPPMAVMSARSQTQSFTNGSQAAPQLFFDTVHVDTTGGVGLIPGWPNWYVVTTPGFYEIDASVAWSLTGGGLGGYTGQVWIVVAQQAAQALASGIGSPTTVNQYVCPIGEAVRFNSVSMAPTCAPTTRMYLGLGDMVCIAAEQNYSSSRGTTTAGAGSMMSLRFVGLGRMDDRTEINSAINNGGTVSLVSHGTLQQATFFNTHTYSYQGDKGFSPNARRNTDLACFQGLNGAQTSEGSQVSQIAFSVSGITSILTGHTPLSVTLTATNLTSYYSTGAKMMLGTTSTTPGGSSYDPGSGANVDIMHQSFTQGQVLTFVIPISIINGFVTGSTKALILGDGDTKDLNYFGSWSGGPGAWSMVVNYV